MSSTINPFCLYRLCPKRTQPGEGGGNSATLSRGSGAIIRRRRTMGRKSQASCSLYLSTPSPLTCDGRRTEFVDRHGVEAAANLVIVSGALHVAICSLPEHLVVCVFVFRTAPALLRPLRSELPRTRAEPLAELRQRRPRSRRDECETRSREQRLGFQSKGTAGVRIRKKLSNRHA